MEVLAKLPAAEHRDGDHLKQVLKALSAFRRGEPGVSLPTEWDGLFGKIAAEFNELSSQTARTNCSSNESAPPPPPFAAARTSPTTCSTDAPRRSESSAGRSSDTGRASSPVSSRAPAVPYRLPDHVSTAGLRGSTKSIADVLPPRFTITSAAFCSRWA